MTAAYCGVSIAYQARDAIFGLVLWQIHDLIVPSVRVRRCQQRALLTHIFKSSGVETFGRSQSILFKNLWSAIAMQPKCGKYFWDHCCQWWAQALERHAARHQFPNYCLEKVKCRTICDNNSFKTYLKVHHTCRARQKRIEIEIDAKFQNASGGVLENSFKSESESFIEADVKSSTVIPPNRVYLQPAPKVLNIRNVGRSVQNVSFRNGYDGMVSPTGISIRQQNCLVFNTYTWTYPQSTS